jgi:hypothetical protein
VTDYPRGGDVSGELTEVRTVCSRAETAITTIRRYMKDPFRYSDSRYGGNLGYDPEAEEMLADLQNVVGILARWRKQGATKRRV